MQFSPLLKNIGLSDKEAAVYVACLELGPSPVQAISRAAQVARASTYAVLEALMADGLVSRYEVGKKTVFQAESPQHLRRIIEKEAIIVEKKQTAIDHVLPLLEAVEKSGDSKPLVRYFSGLEGLRTMRHEMLRQSTASDTWHSITPIDHLRRVFNEDEFLYYKPRRAKRVRSKIIFTTSSPAIKEELLAREKDHFAERRYVDPARLASSSGITIFSSKIAIGTFEQSLGGVIIESQSMADLLRSTFLLLWDSLAVKK